MGLSKNETCFIFGPSLADASEKQQDLCLKWLLFGFGQCLFNDDPGFIPQDDKQLIFQHSPDKESQNATELGGHYPFFSAAQYKKGSVMLCRKILHRNKQFAISAK